MSFGSVVTIRQLCRVGIVRELRMKNRSAANWEVGFDYTFRSKYAVLSNADGRMFQIECTPDIQSLLDDTETWNSLAGGVPFRETSWLGPWWSHFGTHSEAHVLVARDQDEQVRGLLPLYRPAENPHSLAMIGDGRACSDYVSVLAAPHDAEQIAEEFAVVLAATASDRWLGWSSIEIDGIVEGDKPMEAFCNSASLVRCDRARSVPNAHLVQATQ